MGRVAASSVVALVIATAVSVAGQKLLHVSETVSYLIFGLSLVISYDLLAYRLKRSDT